MFCKVHMPTTNTPPKTGGVLEQKISLCKKGNHGVCRPRTLLETNMAGWKMDLFNKIVFIGCLYWIWGCAINDWLVFHGISCLCFTIQPSTLYSSTINTNNQPLAHFWTAPFGKTQRILNHQSVISVTAAQDDWYPEWIIHWNKNMVS